MGHPIILGELAAACPEFVAIPPFARKKAKDGAPHPLVVKKEEREDGAGLETRTTAGLETALQRSWTPALQRSWTPALQRSWTPALQRSWTPALQVPGL